MANMILGKSPQTIVHSTGCKGGIHMQEALALEDGEVEAWVIRASGRKLLEARIDQLRGRVAVTRIPQRTFTADQWRQLTAQLGAWKVQPPVPLPASQQDCCTVGIAAAGKLHGIL